MGIVTCIIIGGAIELMILAALVICLSVFAKRVKKLNDLPKHDLPAAEPRDPDCGAADAAWQEYYRQNPQYAQWIVHLHMQPAVRQGAQSDLAPPGQPRAQTPV
jgi:hypothetical protein